MTITLGGKDKHLWSESVPQDGETIRHVYCVNCGCRMPVKPLEGLTGDCPDWKEKYRS